MADCASCRAPMSLLMLSGHSGGSIAVDVCRACQGFWFDQHESLQLSPGATLDLFRLIADETGKPKPRLSPVLRCPRCRVVLNAVQDMQRLTPFRYWRCDAHGRFISFFEFLREKNFVKPLSPVQLAELRKNVQTLNCSNCGAPIDLAHESACAHCGSAVSMLDMKQAGELVDQLRRAAEPRAIDPALPLELARARREVEASFAELERGAGWGTDVSGSGLVEAGIAALLRWVSPER